MIFNVIFGVFFFQNKNKNKNASLFLNQATNQVNNMPNSRMESPVACEVKECGGHKMLADTLKVICDIYNKYLREHTSAKEGKDPPGGFRREMVGKPWGHGDTAALKGTW